VKFWTSRSSQEIQECASANRVDTSVSRSMTLGRRIMGAGHPVNEVRVESLKGELARWEAERVEARVKAGLTPAAAAA
jgi:citrate synthase